MLLHEDVWYSVIDELPVDDVQCFLLENEWIDYNEGFADLTQEQLTAIDCNRDLFIEKVQKFMEWYRK